MILKTKLATAINRGFEHSTFWTLFNQTIANGRVANGNGEPLKLA